MTEDFNKWWDSDGIAEDNSYREASPVFWAWEGWHAALKTEREAIKWNSIHSCHADCQNPACVIVREAVAAEREACAKICEEPWQGHPYDIAKQIRARGQK